MSAQLKNNGTLLRMLDIHRQTSLAATASQLDPHSHANSSHNFRSDLPFYKMDCSLKHLEGWTTVLKEVLVLPAESIFKCCVGTNLQKSELLVDDYK